MQDSSKLLRRLNASVLLAIGVALVAACHTHVAIDCTGAKAAPGGLLLCASGAVDRSASAACPTGCTPAPESCDVPCTQDGDCGTTGICYCGPNGGVCTVGACRTNADCAHGHSCIRFIGGTCGGPDVPPSFVCTSDSDECVSDAECGAGEACLIDADHLACTKVATGPCSGG
jgi:hypothetical protein